MAETNNLGDKFVAAIGGDKTNGAPKRNLGDEYLAAIGTLPSSEININAPPVRREIPPGIERYARPNVPLDVTSGAGFTSRLGLSFITDPENRAAHMRNAFAGSQVDTTPDGQMIVRNVLDPQTGQTKDLLVDEKDITLKDIADMTGAGVKTGLEILALKGLGRIKAISKLGSISRLGVDSAAASVVGNTTDAAVNSLLDPSRTGQFATESTKAAERDTGLGMLIGGGIQAAFGVGNTAQGVVGGELATGETERTGIRALQAIERDTGIKIVPSLGQMAESPDILRLETFLERLPLLGNAFRQQRARRESAIADLQNKMLGNAPAKPMSDIGANLVDMVQTAVEQPQMAADMAETSIAKRAADQIETAVQNISPSARSFTSQGTSALTKFSAQSRMNHFRKISDELFTEAGNPEISTAPLKPLLEKVRDSLPKRTVINESDLVDVAGRPLATTEGKEIVRELVPSELQRFLGGLDKLDPTMPLDQLRRIRSTVDNAIVEGRGLEGVSTYELKQLQHAITQAINEGASQLGEQGVSIMRANAFYKENIERFEVPMVARLLKQSRADPGYIGSEEFSDLLRNKADRFNDVAEFLQGSLTEGGKAIGPTAESTLNVLRRSLVERALSKARINPGSSKSAINSDAFIAEMQHYSPEMRSQLLGASEETINRNLDLLKQLKEGFKDVPADKLDAFLRFPANSVQDLSRLATARKAEADLFKNEVIGKLLKGESADLNELRSDTGLDWLLKAKNKGDVAQVMAIAGDNPQLVEDIRRNAVARLFQEASQKTTPAEAALIGSDNVLISPERLIDIFRNGERASKLRVILGQETFNLMENFAKSQAVLGKTGTSTLIGSSTGTSMLVHMLKFLKDVPHAAKLTIYSALLTNPGMQKAIMEGSLKAATDPREFAQLAIASVPVLDALGEQYGKTGAEMVIQMAKDSIKSAGNLYPRSETQLNRRGKVNDFSIRPQQ